MCVFLVRSRKGISVLTRCRKRLVGWRSGKSALEVEVQLLQSRRREAEKGLSLYKFIKYM